MRKEGKEGGRSNDNCIHGNKVSHKAINYDVHKIQAVSVIITLLLKKPYVHRGCFNVSLSLTKF